MENPTIKPFLNWVIDQDRDCLYAKSGSYELTLLCNAELDYFFYSVSCYKEGFEQEIFRTNRVRSPIMALKEAEKRLYVILH